MAAKILAAISLFLISASAEDSRTPSELDAGVASRIQQAQEWPGGKIVLDTPDSWIVVEDWLKSVIIWKEVRVEGKRNPAATRSSSLWPGIAHVWDVFVVEDKLLLQGSTLNREIELLAVHRFDTLEQINLILCRNMVMSPTGRFAVFDDTISNDGSPVLTGNHATLLYDALAKSESPSSQGAESKWDGAHPIYHWPEGAGTRLVRLRYGYGEDTSKWWSIPSYTWSRDEKHLAFLVKRPTGDSDRPKVELTILSLDALGYPIQSRLISPEQVDGEPFMLLKFDGKSILLEQRRGSEAMSLQIIDWQ